MVKQDFRLFITLGIVAAIIVSGLYVFQQHKIIHGQLPEVHFYDKQAEKLSLNDFQGKVVLVNIWATWCPPCVVELPALLRLKAVLPEDKFSVVAISLDRTSQGEIEKFLQEKQLTALDLYWDKDRQIPLKWRYKGLPTSYLLDTKGRVVKQYDGVFEWDKEPVLSEIKALADL